MSLLPSLTLMLVVIKTLTMRLTLILMHAHVAASSPMLTRMIMSLRTLTFCLMLPAATSAHDADRGDDSDDDADSAHSY